jgi:hypothetical protein
MGTMRIPIGSERDAWRLIIAAGVLRGTTGWERQ